MNEENDEYREGLDEVSNKYRWPCTRLSGMILTNDPISESLLLCWAVRPHNGSLSWKLIFESIYEVLLETSRAASRQDLNRNSLEMDEHSLRFNEEHILVFIEK